jgi:sugar phosphate isomerase/epimerase
MAKGEYSINDIYQGGYSALKPNYGDLFTNYRLVNPSTLGLAMDFRTANVMQDASLKLNTGAKHIEISTIQPADFESIPDRELKEINRLSKLVGATVSVHGPMVEPSGMSREGFTDANREASERQMFSAVERGHLVDPKGNVPITFHSSIGIPGDISSKDKPKEETLVVNTESGSIAKIPLKESNFPGELGKKDVKAELNRINEEQWNNQLRQLEYYAGMGGEAVSRAMPIAMLAEIERKKGHDLTPEEKLGRAEYNRGTTFLNSSYNDLKQVFDLAYSRADEKDKNKINDFYRDIQQKAEKIKNNPKSTESVTLRKEIIDEGINTLKEVSAPQLYEDLNEFAKEKTIQTFANVAFKAFTDKKVGNMDVSKTPIISIENPPAGGAFSRGEELKEIVEKSRDAFVEKAKKEGISEATAREAADKLIGVTWDVGHINMLRKYGYESGDIVKESEQVAKLVKHVHLSDNFGMEHTELPMGMGNVPIKEILQKLGKEGFDAKKVIEAGNWWQHFKTPPFKETLEAFGSPIYSMQMAPYWNQAIGLQQGYYGGLQGQWLPQINYETFGSSFSRLPSELGGQRQGAEGSRMSGRGME